MLDNTISFICDEPAGGLYVLKTSMPLTREICDMLAARLKAAMTNADGGPVIIVLNDGDSLERISGPSPGGGWPDWEHCAA